MPTLHPGTTRNRSRTRPTPGSPTPGSPTPGSTTRSGPWRWLVGSAVLFFLVPFVGTDLLGLRPDLYHVAYFTVAVVWSVAFLTTYGAALRDLWRPHLGWSLVVGALAGAGVVSVVLTQSGTGHPDGWRWWFGIGWRGVVYGSVDTVVLFVFPAAVAYLVLHGNRAGAARKVGYAALVLALSLVMSTAYHLGYPEYRGADLRSPLVGTVMANSAAVATGNPVGAFLTHVPAHTSAAVHQYRGGPTHMLPPRTTADHPDRGDGDWAVGLAGVWLLGTAGTLTLLARHERAGSSTNGKEVNSP